MVMIYNLKKIDNKNKEKLYDLNEYMELAKKCIGKFADGSLCRKMLMDEDAISYVTEHIMYGACRYEDDRGMQFFSYLVQCAKWAIMSWKTMLKKHADGPKFNDILDENLNIKYENDMSISMIVDEIIDLSNITKKQKQCLIHRYFDNMTYVEIGDKLGMCRESARQEVNRAILKIKKTFNQL